MRSACCGWAPCRFAALDVAVIALNGIFVGIAAPDTLWNRTASEAARTAASVANRFGQVDVSVVVGKLLSLVQAAW